MNIKVPKSEVDEQTAELLEARAAARGISVSELLAELAGSDNAGTDAESLAELERRWQNAAAEATVPHDNVVRWLETWGTPAFKPWRDQ